MLYIPQDHLYKYGKSRNTCQEVIRFKFRALVVPEEREGFNSGKVHRCFQLWNQSFINVFLLNLNSDYINFILLFLYISVCFKI